MSGVSHGSELSHDLKLSTCNDSEQNTDSEWSNGSEKSYVRLVEVLLGSRDGPGLSHDSEVVMARK